MPRPCSHPLTWNAWIVLALVLYVLSIGPAKTARTDDYISADVYAMVYLPIWLVAELPHVDDWLSRYLDLWPVAPFPPPSVP